MKNRFKQKKADEEVEIIHHFDEQGKSFDELMQELIIICLPK